MKIYGWEELARLAKERSPYYRDLYQGLNGFTKLHELPVVDQATFWSANTIRDNRLLTATLTDGIAFKSGGTTGNPKFSVFTRDEWNTFTHFFGEGMSQAGLRDGDRIANLFYVGELYASFIFIMKSLEAVTMQTIQFPIGGSTNPDNVLKTLDDFQINVLAGLPTTLLTIAEHYAVESGRYPHIRVEKILFGGESMYHDQRKRLQTIFPGVTVSSIGYASVDAGLLGYADSSCAPDEHRAFGQATILEIVDEETGAVIEEPDKPGNVLITNLTRALIPIIRYPVGDRAVWKEPLAQENADRKFLILGRSEEAARVGPVSVYFEDMRSFLDKADLSGLQITAFQLITRHFELKDSLTLRLATPDGDIDTAQVAKRISSLFDIERPMFAQAAAKKIIHPLMIEWAAPTEIEINARTGKLRRVIDQRC